ncbi:SIMPL domain-containing protein [Candidatus Halobonum tyrrellensis]|uniref:DUF541 domain-containing protein n=1 Tax=Candidatus Halobonum tyrrellensis G22 TaxID=1324957 RepID=V4HET7_9EURY|nr:SIMPL domain-containing protein [Candidatus Halobonum tyrrellensis]ESP89210.1 hypothetical protein K933_05153 [Candidatus Halobonum tyrrellensis G22]
MDPRPKYVLLAALAVLLAGCAGAATDPTAANATAANATTQTQTDAHTVTAGGTGEVSADPDVAVVSVAVEARADTAEAARDAVAADAETLSNALSEAGLSANTTGYALSPEYDYGDDSRELVGYRAFESFEVETDVDRAGEAVDIAVDNGATRVDGVRFDLSDERRADLGGDAIAAAMADARTDADAAAGAVDRSVGTVVSVDVDTDGTAAPYAARETAADAGGATTFQPGPVTVTATVSVTYELSESAAGAEASRE